MEEGEEGRRGFAGNLSPFDIDVWRRGRDMHFC
jgi:hypothetical protein